MKVCPHTGCPVLIPRTSRFCPTHAREHEARRGTPTQRGYDLAHRRLRAQWQRRLNAGEVIACAKCGKPVDPTAWDLGHTADRTGWTGPECRTCNRSDGGRRAHQP